MLTDLLLNRQAVADGDFDINDFGIINAKDSTTPKGYTTLQQVEALIQSSGTEINWRDDVLDNIITPPASPSDKDSYIIGLDTSLSVATGDWAGHDGQIARYNASTSSWEFETPINGWIVLINDETDKLYIFSGTTWTARNFENTTASGFLEKIGNDIQFTNLTDGRILIGDSSGNPQARVLNGDVTIDNTGVATVVSASTTDKGKIEIATQTEVNTGTDTERAVVPSTLLQKIIVLRKSETFIDGAGFTAGQNTITLASTSLADNWLDISRNGQDMEIGAGNDFTKSGNVLTFARVLRPNDKITAKYLA